MDRHVLGAVVLEHAGDVRGPRDECEVTQEDRDPDEPFGQVLDQPVVLPAGRDGGDEEREEEEDADTGDQSDAEHHRDRALAELDPLFFGLDVRAADQPARPDDERFVQDDQAANQRPFRPRRPVEARIEPLGGKDDPAVRVAHRDRDRIATAHEDALDQGLTAVGVLGHGSQSTGCG
jgi:hypothetical protein